MEVEKVNSRYFWLIVDQLTVITKRAPWANQVLNQLNHLKMDVRFMRAFCLCIDTMDEESLENLKSIIVPIKSIWLNEHEGLGLSLLNRDMSIEDFQTAIIELEARILQSKQKIEGWCENLMHFKMSYCHSSTFFEIRYYLKHIRNCLINFSSYRAAKIVKLKKQIRVLKGRIVFLEESLSNIESCPSSNEILQFLNFALAFANNAMCLAFLYWSKEDNEGNITEMNTVLFDMLQKFISYASDITPLYIGILKSYDLQPSDSFSLGEAVESFVDFFFEHLDAILKDDFLILRDRLTNLFTFLIDPPCLDRKEEDLIRSQIYALFREDAYLVLPFDKMKDDFSDIKILLGDCMIKIDLTIAKIRELYSGFGDSWIRLEEVEEMEYVYFVSVQRELSWIEKHAQWAKQVVGQLRLYRTELRFLRVFLLCFTTWDDDADEAIRVRLSSMITSFRGIWEEKEEKGLLAHRLHAIRTGGIIDWHPLVSELEGKIQLSKQEIEVWWLNSFHLSFRCKPSTPYKILKCLDSIVKNLNDLVTYKASETVLFKKQIEILEEKVLFLKIFLKLTVNCVNSKILDKFNMFVQVFANDAACLTFFYWAKDANDDISSETNSMLSRMLQKIKPTTSDVAGLYFETLKAIYVQGSNSLMFGQTVLSFVDLFLQDDFQILRDNIVFLSTFLNDPPDKKAQEFIYSQIDVLFWEGLYDFLRVDDMEGNFLKKNVLPSDSDFMMKIETVNASIKQTYCKFPDSSQYNFPKIISPQFLDFLIQNLRNLKEKLISERKYAPFARYKIIQIEEELVSLCRLFNHIFDLQSEQKETWLEVVNSIHLTEHVISLCISSRFVVDHPIWYSMAYLSDVLDGIKVVRAKLEKIKEDTTYNARFLPHSPGFISTPSSEHASPSEINEIVVGFENEAKRIIRKLTSGHKPFDIVSIVGMGGLGKTTLAKMVYGSSAVKSNFNVSAFCFVSQDHNTRRLLVDILSDIKGVDYGNSDMTDNDLAHQLWKCLSRQKYLVVLDDIWSISVWNEIKSSFPDHKNGSKVMFTTRSREVANQCKITSHPYKLRFLSAVESWELLQKKVFRDGIAPSYLHEIGMIIAKNCKGLPLAVVVIAGLLARTEKSLKCWNEVAERLFSYLSDEGCMRILELSYKHLPEYLKPCLVYLGAFPEDKLIRVKHVILLWIGEGFIQESETKSIEDVAKEYLHDLADRSLIIFSPRSSNGEIKTFRVHDLIHDLCRTKCVDGNFFHLNHGTTSSTSSPAPSINNQYRVSTQKLSDVTIAARGSSYSNARSLLYFGEQRYERFSVFPVRELRLAQVLDLDLNLLNDDLKQLASMVHLRHLNAKLRETLNYVIPSSIANLWNLRSFMLTSPTHHSEIHLPDAFWRMKSLRYVKIEGCILKFSDFHEHEAYLILDNVVSFSKPCLYTGKDVQQLLQRLPSVRELSCFLKKSIDYHEESVETLDFHRKLESLKLTQLGKRRRYLIDFPSSLTRLTLVKFQLPWTAISAIAELHCLQFLKLRSVSFPEPRLDWEDMTFQNLKFFELYNLDLVEWNASTESLPCLEQLVIECPKLEELPSCLEEISTLKRIVVRESSQVESSALRIKEESMELGNRVEVSIYNSYSRRPEI